MGLIVGIDEAGYGPNLGPLVVTATVWEVPGRPKSADLWAAFADVADPSGSRDDERLHVADSKQVYSPARGLGSLERGVLAAFGVASVIPSQFDDLLNAVTADDGSALRASDEPWSNDGALALPISDEGRKAEPAVAKWQLACREHGIRLRDIQCEVVSPMRWNKATRDADNKATALSRITLQLLRRVWDPDTSGTALVLADKHGGRNRYAALLTECLAGRMALCRRESRAQSIYRVARTDIHFEARSERHFPVALSSMVSKYVRELSMTLFNRFWCGRLPGLNPTHGYPMDSHRFRRDVAALQARLDIPDDVLWRER